MTTVFHVLTAVLFSPFTDRHVSQLKFVVREDADSLVVAANGDSGCLIEIWELREKPLPIHKLFQPKSHSSQTEPFKTVVSYGHVSCGIAMLSATPYKLCVVQLAGWHLLSTGVQCAVPV